MKTAVTGALVSLLAIGPLAATGIRNPVTGYVFDQARGAIRPINGLPGAAVVGPALESPVEFSQVVFAAGHRRALGTGTDGRSYLLTFDGNQMEARGIDGPAVEMAAFDRAGNRAVVSAGGALRLLESDGRLGETLNVAGAGAAVTAMAIDNGGKTIALASMAGESVSIHSYELGADQAQLVTSAASVESLAFSAAGQLAIADRVSNRVLVAVRGSNGWQVEVAASANDGLVSPTAAQFDESGSLVMLSGGTGEVVIRTAAGLDRLKLDAAAARLEPLAAAHSMHLVPARGVTPGAALHLLDMERSARLVFVPAGGQQ